MTDENNQHKTVSTRELLLAQMIQIDTLCQLLIDKEIITEEEFYEKLKEVQIEYQEAKKA